MKKYEYQTCIRLPNILKEEIDNRIYKIHAKEYDKDMLKSITISETDRYFDNKSTIFSPIRNIRKNSF